MNAKRRWQKALALANCPCNTGGVPVRSPADCWSMRWEYWNTWDNGHMVLASLMLDGLACEDLP